METTVKQRLLEFIAYKGISVRSFERECGLSYGYVNNMRVSIQPEKLTNIARCFPELNAGWIITGDGEMIRKNEEPQQVASSGVLPLSIDGSFLERENRLLSIIESQQKTIEKLTDLASSKKQAGRVG